MVWDTAFGKLHQSECRHERSAGPMSAYQRGAAGNPAILRPKKFLAGAFMVATVRRQRFETGGILI